jgi:hypothetical protein
MEQVQQHQANQQQFIMTHPVIKALWYFFIFVMLHYGSYWVYGQLCVFRFNPINLFIMPSPVCTYLLEIVNLCQTIIKNSYLLFGGYMLAQVKTIFKWGVNME